MATTNILISGFGGQGILFLGKLLANSGLNADKEVSWLPSYGPEMRGGTANCSVIVSEKSVGSPIVSKPNLLICMNNPSFEKYEDKVVKNGFLFYDNSLISKTPSRKDIKYFGLPATSLASDNNLSGLANMIILGKIIKENNFLSKEVIEKTINEFVGAKKPELLQKNLTAIKIGLEN